MKSVGHKIIDDQRAKMVLSGVLSINDFFKVRDHAGRINSIFFQITEPITRKVENG